MSSLKLNHLFKALFSKFSHMGIRDLTYEFGGGPIQFKTTYNGILFRLKKGGNVLQNGWTLKTLSLNVLHKNLYSLILKCAPCPAMQSTQLSKPHAVLPHTLVSAHSYSLFRNASPSLLLPLGESHPSFQAELPHSVALRESSFLLFCAPPDLCTMYCVTTLFDLACPSATCKLPKIQKLFLSHYPYQAPHP